MDLTDLRIFTAVVREGGITRAAEKLHRVQSNVTTRIRQLESKLDTKLFNREGKRLILTSSGRVLLEYADRLLDLAEEAREALHAERPIGTFRLGAMESTAAVRLPAVLSVYTKRHPDVVLDLRTGNPIQLSNAVIDGDIDAALIAEPVADTRFDSIEAFEEEPVIVTSIGEPPIGEDMPGPKTIIVFEHGCPHRRLLEKWYAQRNDMPERTIELGSYHAMLGCVLAGMGAALVPRSVISTFPEQDRLRINPLPQGENRLRTMLIWRKNVRSPKVSALADILNS
ncbi:MAG: LysR substrate-binding domain-containing protein [Pseudomonadota bacterium]